MFSCQLHYLFIWGGHLPLVCEGTPEKYAVQRTESSHLVWPVGWAGYGVITDIAITVYGFIRQNTNNEASTLSDLLEYKFSLSVFYRVLPL